MHETQFFELLAINKPFAFYLCGTIIFFMLGISVGNFATSLVFRLPRGLKIAHDSPYCECERQVYLKNIDMFPVFSWLLARGKCRYCTTVKVPAIYTVIEALCGISFVLNWVMHGMGEKLILVLIINVLLITIASIYFQSHKYFISLFVGLIGAGSTYRTLIDGTIFNAVYAAYWAMMLGLVIWQIECFIAKKKLPYQDYITIMGLGALCVGLDDLLFLIIASFTFACGFAAMKKFDANFQHSCWVLGTCASVILLLGLH
jgi:prepilin signal peptidase PulO-like enzyme (type II secretory pathway)